MPIWDFIVSCVVFSFRVFKVMAISALSLLSLMIVIAGIKQKHLGVILIAISGFIFAYILISGGW